MSFSNTSFEEQPAATILSRTFFDFHYSKLYTSLENQSISTTSAFFLPTAFVAYVTLPYVILTVGLFSNALSFLIVYTNRTPTNYSHYMLILLVFDSLFIIMTMTNLVTLSTSQHGHTLMTYSPLTCKLTVYAIHVFTNMSNWMKSLITYTVSSSLRLFKAPNNSNPTRYKWHITLASLVLFSVLFLFDLGLVEQIEQNGYFICGIRSVRLRLLVNIIDLVSFYFVSLYFLLKHMGLVNRLAVAYSSVNPVIGAKYRKLVFGVKLAPVLYSLWNLPVCALPIVYDLFVLTGYRRIVNSFGFDVAMYLFFMNFYFNNILNIFYNLYYNKNLRKPYATTALVKKLRVKNREK